MAYCIDSLDLRERCCVCGRLCLRKKASNRQGNILLTHGSEDNRGAQATTGIVADSPDNSYPYRRPTPGLALSLSYKTTCANVCERAPIREASVRKTHLCILRERGCTLGEARSLSFSATSLLVQRPSQRWLHALVWNKKKRRSGGVPWV